MLLSLSFSRYGNSGVSISARGNCNTFYSYKLFLPVISPFPSTVAALRFGGYYYIRHRGLRTGIVFPLATALCLAEPLTGTKGGVGSTDNTLKIRHIQFGLPTIETPSGIRTLFLIPLLPSQCRFVSELFRGSVYISGTIPSAESISGRLRCGIFICVAPAYLRAPSVETVMTRVLGATPSGVRSDVRIR